MRILSVLILIVGMALAGGAAYYVDKINRFTVGNARTQEYVSILVAKRSLTENHRIVPGDVAFIDWPAHLLPPGAFRSVDDLLGQGANGVRVVSRSIDAQSPIVASRVYNLGDPGGIENRIPRGWRAISLPISATTGVAGFILPGDRVDITLIHSVGGTLTSQVVLHAVEVLAIGQSMETDRIGAQLGGTATVLVTQRDAQLLGIAMQKGSLSLTLMGQDDGQSETRAPETSPFTEKDLPGLAPAPEETERFIWKRDGEGNRVKIQID